VALYRFERDGWTIDDVSAEMRRQSYREGWLPGYIYNMVRDRPMQERYEPPVTHDRNLPAAEAGSDDDPASEIATNKEVGDVR
jgi:hypothetical protein